MPWPGGLGALLAGGGEGCTGQLLCMAGASFKICAFNMQGFGEAKAGDAHVSLQILARCDISAVQEVRDAKGDAVLTLLTELNRYQALPALYAQLGSRRLGRGTYKEQIVFIYRLETLPGGHLLLASMHPAQVGHPLPTGRYACPGTAPCFPPGGLTPAAALGNQVPSLTASPLPAIKDFVLLSHHASPRNAVHEIDRLYGLCRELTQRWGTQNVMVLGDLNAGGAYVPPSAWGSIRLRWEPSFHWLIGDTANTTVRARTHCAYDRIVVQGDEMLGAVVPGSAKPYNFARSLGLSEEEVSAGEAPHCPGKEG
uniref:Deoxyribonuclease n=1 Tax=Pelusios castaneus TaxID=367368 RepID=A0A8C8VK82_9SAUR